VNWSLLGIFLAGIVLIVVAHAWHTRTFDEAGAFREIVQDTIRDLGIAFLVSSVVAKLFELYRSLRHSIESMKDVVDATMADKLTRDVWFQLEDLIDNKSVLRKDLRVRLEVGRDAKLKTHEAILRAEVEYAVEGVGRRRHPVTIAHDLDYQLTNDELNLPRFEQITIGKKQVNGDEEAEVTSYGPAEIGNVVRNGRFRQEIEPLRGGESVQVQLVRHELVYLPGSYNFYTPEFTMGLIVSVAKVPDDIQVEVWVRPQGEQHAPPRLNREWRTTQLILPGQGVEIKFLSKAPKEDKMCLTAEG
jgi:hypothetical protein